jgi:hexosaminidase
MYRGWNPADLDLLKVKNQHLIEPCIWSYPGDKPSFDSITNISNLGNTLVNFPKIWVASAFKGCYNPSSTHVDHELRFSNQSHWVEFVKNCNFKDKIQGIILTGWSRFTHETVLCEVLPMSIPSLTLCLAVIDHQRLNCDIMFQDLIKTLLINPKCLKQDYIQERLQQLTFDQANLEKFLKETPFIESL